MFCQSTFETVTAISPDKWVDDDVLPPEQLTDKIILVDFWFTRCAPCIYTIPHLNDLAKKYRPLGVEFIAISFESTKRVRQFLKERPMLARVGIDSTGRLRRLFGVESYPTTFLIDKSGQVVWHGYPGKVTEGMLDFLLGGAAKGEVMADETEAAASGEVDGTVLYDVQVRKNLTPGAGSGHQYSRSRVDIFNKSIVDISSLLLGISEQRVRADNLSDVGYDVEFAIKKPDKSIDLKPVAFEAVLKELHIDSKWQSREEDAFVLTAADPELLVKNALESVSTAGGMSRSETAEAIVMKNADLNDLARELEGILGSFVVNETGLNGFFHFTIPRAEAKDLGAYLLSQYGLALQRSVRTVEVLVLTTR